MSHNGGARLLSWQTQALAGVGIALLALTGCSNPSATEKIPTSVENAANRAAWEHAKGTEDLDPAVCNRRSETAYRCLARAHSTNKSPEIRYEMDIEHYRNDVATVSNLSRTVASP